MKVPSALWPKAGDFFAPEASAHADDCVMACDTIAANQAEQTAAKEGKKRASRLDRNEEIGLIGNALEQNFQLFMIEMMQEEIGDKSGVGDAWLGEPIENIRCHDLCIPAEFAETVDSLRGDEIDLVNKQDLEWPGRGRKCAGAFEQKCSVTSAKVHDGIDPAIGVILPPGFDQQPDMAHNAIEPPQVFARTERAAVVRRQLIEQLRFGLPLRRYFRR